MKKTAQLTDRFHTAQEIIALPTELLAGFLLEHLEAIRTADPRNSERMLDLHDTVAWIVEQYAKTGFGRTTDLRRVIAEAWNWLMVEGLVALDPESSGGHLFFITRRGMQCRTHDGVEEYRKRRLLSPELLHNAIRDCSLGDYLAGDFESAILKAFRKVEIEMRSACGYSAGETGVPLARKAFQPLPNPGPLTVTTELPGEQQALSDLFAGAMGRFRNPAAHGTRTFDDPIEAAQLLLFASHLMTIIDERRPK
ncbi:MAG: TIGR02391 family protein [Planctomycetaceae bacterium]